MAEKAEAQAQDLVVWMVDVKDICQLRQICYAGVKALFGKTQDPDKWGRGIWMDTAYSANSWTFWTCSCSPSLSGKGKYPCPASKMGDST